MQIHELNNYIGQLGSGAFLAVDDGTDTGKISTEALLTGVNNAINEVDNDLNGRIDNIIAGGAAPSEAEITDARRGADGVDYSSLGAAIRTQFSDVNDSIFDTTVQNPDVGYYYDNTGTRKANASWKTLKLRIDNVFYDNYVHGTGSIAYYSTTYPSYIFLDAAGSVLEAKFVNVDNLANITADLIPSGAAWIVFNSTNPFTVTIKGINQILDKKIDAEILTRVAEDNNALAVPVSEYISELATNVYKLVTPVNLLHGTFTTGYIIGNDGTISANASYSYSDYFEISGNKKVCITRQVTAATRSIEDYMSIAFYDKDKAFISRGVGLIKNVPADAKYARQNVVNSYNTNNYKLMVEYTDNDGTIAPEYSQWFDPYYDYGSNPGTYYQNKNLCVFGDSLAANGSGGTDTWIQRVGDALGFDKVYNRGVGGSRVAATQTAYAYVDADGDAYNRVEYLSHQTIEGYTEIDACCSSVARANTIPTDTDVLLILAGANDVGNTTLADFTTAYKTMLDNIYSRIPEARVMLCTMPFHLAFDTGSSAAVYQSFRDAIKEIGAEYGFPIIDFKSDMMVNKNNYQDFMASDYVHYTTSNGRARFAEVAIPKVEDIRYI